jgi:hypothetical protein
MARGAKTPKTFFANMDAMLDAAGMENPCRA